MMKRKFLACIAAVLATATTFASCGNVNYKTSFKAYWRKNSSSNEQVSEELVYDVLFTATDGKPLNNYTLQYDKGTYKTTLVSKTVNNELVYEYKTRLDITGKFSFEGNVCEFTDYVVSEVTFKSTVNGLTPIQSKKEFSSHSPANIQADANTNFSAWKQVGRAEIDHVAKTSKTVLLDTEGTEVPWENTIKLSKQNQKYSYLDNEQLWVAIRAIEQTANAAPKFSVYAPFTGKVQTVSATFKASITEENFSFMKDGTQVTQNVTYFPVELVLDEKNAGSAQTLWIAATKDAKNNTLRNVVIKNIVKVPYNIGTLTYQLKEATFHF